MNKTRKKIIFISGMIVFPAIINYVILKKNAAKNENYQKGKYYSFRYGRIHYKAKGEGKPLLLIHGVGLGAGMHEWEKNISMLSKNFKVYAIDLLGFGHSDKPNITYSPYMYVNLITEFVKNVIGESVCVAATTNSAPYTVFASLFEPEFFEKMILINPAGTEDCMPTEKDSFLRRILETPLLGTSLFHLLTSKMFCRMFLENSTYKNSVSNDIVNQYYEAAHFGGVNAKYSAAAFVSKFLNTNIKHKISSIKIPTLVL